MKKINLSGYFPILGFEDHLVYASNGNVLLCYQVNLPEIYSQSERDFEELHSLWFQAFKSLPVGTVIHKQDCYQKEKYAADRLPDDSFLSKATRRHFKEREYLEHNSYLFFVLPYNKASSVAKYANPFVKLQKGMYKQIDHLVEGFIMAVNDSVSFINNSKKIILSPLKEERIIDLTFDYFNGFNEGFDTDILLNKSNIAIGDHYFDVLAINNELCFGESVQSSKINDRFTSDKFSFHKGFIDGLALDLNHNHIVNQIFYMDDKQRWRKQLERKIEELHKSANFGTQNKVVLKRIQHIVDRINTDDTSQVIRGHLNIVYWDKNQQSMLAITSKIKAAFKELDIIPYYPKSEERKHYILNSYCCFSTNFSNEDLYVTDLKHALCLYINNTNYKSDPTGIIFNDRQQNIPVLKDLWDQNKKRIKARNFAIFAPTGEGKSFLANNILRQYFESKVRLVIIDLGGSYAKFAKLYPDDHIILRYEQGKNLGINPFFISSPKDLDPERLEDLATFLFELLQVGTSMSKAQEVSVRKILRYYYSKVTKDHSLKSLFDFVEKRQHTLLKELHIKKQHFNIEDFLHIISEYVNDGLYSFLFEVDQDQTYKLEDKRLIVFELDQIKDNKEILSVMLKLIKSAIQRTIWKNKSERGIILFDEFAKQLKFDNVLESVEFYYQAIRKQNGAIGVILQSIHQLPNSAVSASILENTQVIYCLNNEKGYDDLHDRLNLSDHDLNQLRSIKNNLNGSRKYTEIFIKIGKESNVFRLEVPKEVYAAYLTDGEENEKIMELYKEHGDMETAILEFNNPRSTTR